MFDYQAKYFNKYPTTPQYPQTPNTRDNKQTSRLVFFSFFFCLFFFIFYSFWLNMKRWQGIHVIFYVKCLHNLSFNCSWHARLCYSYLYKRLFMTNLILNDIKRAPFVDEKGSSELKSWEQEWINELEYSNAAGFLKDRMKKKVRAESGPEMNLNDFFYSFLLQNMTICRKYFW